MDALCFGDFLMFSLLLSSSSSLLFSPFIYSSSPPHSSSPKPILLFPPPLLLSSPLILLLLPLLSSLHLLSFSHIFFSLFHSPLPLTPVSSPLLPSSPFPSPPHSPLYSPLLCLLLPFVSSTFPPPLMFSRSPSSLYLFSSFHPPLFLSTPLIPSLILSSSPSPQGGDGRLLPVPAAAADARRDWPLHDAEPLGRPGEAAGHAALPQHAQLPEQHLPVHAALQALIQRRHKQPAAFQNRDMRCADAHLPSISRGATCYYTSSESYISSLCIIRDFLVPQEAIISLTCLLQYVFFFPLSHSWVR